MHAFQLETCRGCGRTIGVLEQPMVKNDQLVCAQCHAKPSPDPSEVIAVKATPVPPPPPQIETEDLWGPISPKPKPDSIWTRTTNVEYFAAKRVKLIGVDPDTMVTTTTIHELPDSMTSMEIAATLMRGTGEVLIKVVVLERYWIEKHRMTTLSKLFVGAVVFDLLS